MSMLPFLFDNDWFQRRDIENARGLAESANTRLDLAKLTEVHHEEKMAELQAQLGRLNLIAAGLVRALVERQIVTPSELTEIMRQIDLEDGQEDGQLTASTKNVPKWCPQCEARVPPGKTYCVFCGKTFASADSSPV